MLVDESGVQQPEVRVELDDAMLAGLPSYEYAEAFPN